MSCRDAYSGLYLFDAQLGLYDDTKRDSETAERRVVSMSASIVLPARRAIEAAGTRWVLGKGNADSFFDENLRVSYVAHEATHLATIRTLGQMCRNEAGTSAWGGVAWVKDAAFSEQSSKLSPIKHLHFSQAESVVEGGVVQFDGLYYIVRSFQKSPAGFLVVTSEQMAEPVVEAATLTASGTFNKVTETWSAGSVSVRAIRARWQSLFQYRSTSAPSFGPEDIQLAIAKAATTPQAGQPVNLSDGSWTIQAVADEGDVWLCRASQHA